MRRPRRRGGPLLAAVGLLAMAAPVSAANHVTRVAVVCSQQGTVYEEVVAGLREALSRQAPGVPVEVDCGGGRAGQIAQAVGAARSKGASVLVTLGTPATRAAIEQDPEAPLVATMILGPGDLQGAANATAVFLEFPVATEMEWLRSMLPSLRNVAVLYHGEQSRERAEQAASKAASLGLKLQARKVESPQDLPRALEALASRVEAMWSVPDPVLLNPSTAQPILLFSLRERIPFIGLSQAWVKAGALYALDRDYHDVGAQCGELVARVIAGASVSSVPPATPRRVTYAINARTARQMKIEFPQAIKAGASLIVSQEAP